MVVRVEYFLHYKARRKRNLPERPTIVASRRIRLRFGPITLFDKSALQSLNVDEAVWFDSFYQTVISPLFFVETLADLSKEVEAGRTPEQVVAKTPETGSVVSVDHRHLRLADLDGYQIEFERRPHIPSP
jgi:hypothetical protein